MAQNHRGRKPVDIRGQCFGSIVALCPTEARDPKGFVIWHCRCDCGKEFDLSYNCLRYTPQVSCGCRKSAHSRSLHLHLEQVSSTSIDRIRSGKTPKNNSTGHKGVYLIRGKYVAKINFQRKSYYLGTFSDIEDAIEARQEAQEQLFDSTASFYEKWKARAGKDPQWAKENPISIQVTRKEGRYFDLTLLPQL